MKLCITNNRKIMDESQSEECKGKHDTVIVPATSEPVKGLKPDTEDATSSHSLVPSSPKCSTHEEHKEFTEDRMDLAYGLMTPEKLNEEGNSFGNGFGNDADNDMRIKAYRDANVYLDKGENINMEDNASKLSGIVIGNEAKNDVDINMHSDMDKDANMNANNNAYRVLDNVLDIHAHNEEANEADRDSNSVSDSDSGNEPDLVIANNSPTKDALHLDYLIEEFAIVPSETWPAFKPRLINHLKEVGLSRVPLYNPKHGKPLETLNACLPYLIKRYTAISPAHWEV